MFSKLEKLLGDRTLARARNVSWLGHERGELTVSRGEICVSGKRKSFQFWKRPHVLLRIPTVLIVSVEVATGSQLLIHYMNEEDMPLDEAVIFRRKDEPKHIAGTIRYLLEELGDESKQTKLDRASKERKEREERERQSEFQAVENERVIIWRTAGQVWQIVSELGWLIEALRSENWEVIEKSWQKAMGIEGKSILNLTDNLDSFLPAVESRAADQVYLNTLGFFNLLRSSLDELQISHAEQEELAVRHGVLPQWHHLPYFLYFALLYAETLLCHRAGDIHTIKDNISTLQQLAVIIHEEFGLNLDDHVVLFNAALSTGDSKQVSQTGRDMESYIAEIVERETVAAL